MNKYIVLEKACGSAHEKPIAAKSLRGAMQIATRRTIYNNGRLQIWVYIANQAIMLAEKENYGYKNSHWNVDHSAVNYHV